MSLPVCKAYRSVYALLSACFPCFYHPPPAAYSSFLLLLWGSGSPAPHLSTCIHIYTFHISSTAWSHVLFTEACTSAGTSPPCPQHFILGAPVMHARTFVALDSQSAPASAFSMQCPPPWDACRQRCLFHEQNGAGHREQRHYQRRRQQVRLLGTPVCEKERGDLRGMCVWWWWVVGDRGERCGGREVGEKAGGRGGRAYRAPLHSLCRSSTLLQQVGQDQLSPHNAYPQHLLLSDGEPRLPRLALLI